VSHADDSPGQHYDDLDEEAQVEALRPVAIEAARRFGLDDAQVGLVLHAYNTTFAAETLDGRWALRIGTNSKSTPAMIRAHQAWQHALRAETDVVVPDPLAAPDGDYVVEVDSAGLGRPLLVVAAAWLDGPDLRDPSVDQCHLLGSAMATMHEQALGWQLPEGAELSTFDTPLFGARDLLSNHDWLAPDERSVVDDAMNRTAATFHDAYAGQRLIALHADLHGGNLKAHNDGLAIFDFDDAGLGVPLLDLAIATFYLRDGHDEREQALQAGYAEVRPLPDADPNHLEGLIAARQLLLANTLLASGTASLRNDARDYLGVTVRRLQAWFETGRFVRV
jgi:Ser/Thr protein kinase RdoA (MazF antagonist)